MVWGHKGGEIASRLAVNCIEEYMLNLVTDNPSDNPTSILNNIYKANRLIWAQGGKPEWHEMGTTITAAILKTTGHSQCR